MTMVAVRPISVKGVITIGCNHPKKAFVIGTTPNGKQDLKIVPYGVDHLEFKQGKWHLMSDDFVSPYAEKVSRTSYEIPCGKCLGCKLDYSKHWAERMLLESKCHDENWFITLTYDDEHIHRVNGVDPNTGEFLPNIPTLKKEDFQLFMKRLRKAVEPDNIRFYASAEYGTESRRPHFHAIIFGLHLPVEGLHYYKTDRNHNVLYNSDLIDRCWQNKGFCVCASVTFNTCAYVSRYVTKKLGFTDPKIYESLNIEPECSMMSLKPGIGLPYFEAHPDCVKASHIVVPTDDGGKKFRPPKYFLSKYGETDPEFIENYKKLRMSVAEDIKKARLSETDLDYLEQLLVDEQNLEARTKILKKGDI